MKLKELIKKSPYNNSEVARLVGVTRQYMSLLVNEKEIPSKKLMEKLNILLLGYDSRVLNTWGTPNYQIKWLITN